MEQAPLHTPRLRLLPLSIDDLRAIDAANLDLLAVKIEPAALLETSVAAIAQKIRKMSKLSVSVHLWYTYWLIVKADEETGIGFVGFKGTPDDLGFAEVGYSLSPNYRRQGFMKEALGALIDWARQHPSCRGVTATRVLKDNIGSNKALTGCNFILTYSSRTENNYLLLFPRPSY